MQLKDVATVKGGKRLPKSDTLVGVKTNHPYIRIRDMYQSYPLEINDKFEYITEDTHQKIKQYIVEEGDVIIAVVGNTIGLVSLIGKSLNGANLTENCDKIVNLHNYDNRFLYYFLKSQEGQDEIRKGIVGSSQPKLPIYNIERFEIPDISIDIQMKIVEIIEDIDKKIKTNEEINKNLVEQVLAVYRHRFVDTTNELRQTCRADEYFDISIGKTPPRKEPRWFSTNPKDVTWVSISDMGTCGLYISESSEQLTREAVDRHNVKIVPDNTVLLSFKLTVGRIAITDGAMTTNEAIAHFKTDKKEINEYLYCYLKCFNYQTMGSTSSIATAVNSKIIKGMPFVVPTDEEITEFHSLATSMFAKIKANQTEISNLAALRDTLLPKLMSGELDVSDIDL